MPAIVRSFRHFRPPQLAALALALTACATAVQQDIDDDNGGGNGPPKGGSGGSSATTAGTNNSGGKPPTPSGGAPAAGSGGQVNSGGVQAAAGTTATAGTTAAGGATGACPPPYTGTLAQDSAIFVGGFGTSTMGSWSGYGYTYKYGTATIAPGMGSGCFTGMKFCANGSVPADDMSGAGLGWNIGQTLGATVTTKVPITTPVKVTFKTAAAVDGMRVQLSASSTLSYCYALTPAEATAGTATIPYASFMTACWDTATAVAYDGVTPIEAIQLVVPGSMAAAAKTFDICMLDIEPG